MKSPVQNIAVALFCLGSWACKPAPGNVAQTQTEQDANEDAGDAEDAHSNHLDVPPSIRKNLGITFAPVEVRRVAQTLRVPGSFELLPSASREYRMALPGTVELLVEQYERVEKDQVLFRFESTTWPELLHEIIAAEQAIDTSNSEIAVVRARVTEAGRKVEVARERLQALEDARFDRADLRADLAEMEAGLPLLDAELALTQTRLENARRTREHALHRAAAAAGIAEEELDRKVTIGGEEHWFYETIQSIEVHALASGLVQEMAVTSGAFVEPPGAVLTTVDPTRVRFRALALQGDLPLLHNVREARIVPPQSPGFSVTQALPAALSFGLQAHPDERTMTLLATPLESAVSVEWVRPGVAAFLEVEVASSAGPALAIPQSSIVRDGLSHVFFKRDPKDPDVVLRIEADLGISDGRWVVIESGLARDDQVVLSGAYELKLASERSGVSQQGGHMHADGTFHAPGE